jgi:hypothetical protein
MSLQGKAGQTPMGLSVFNDGFHCRLPWHLLRRGSCALARISSVDLWFKFAGTPNVEMMMMLCSR